MHWEGGELVGGLEGGSVTEWPIGVGCIAVTVTLGSRIFGG